MSKKFYFGKFKKRATKEKEKIKMPSFVFLAKITEIKTTIKDNIKEFVIVFELFNNK